MVDDPAADIYGFWQGCRSGQSVVPIDAMGRQLWFVTRFDDVQTVLHDATLFSSSINAETMGPVMGTVILAMDGDEHRRHRDIVSRAFRPSALARWESELIRPTIDDLIDALSDDSRCDLVADVTSRYPVQVIAGILGVPVEDHALFQRWAVEISMGPENYDVSIPAAAAMREYLRPVVEDRRRQPRSDLVSDIVTAEVDGELLDDELVYGFLRLLLPAGAETTYRAMGNCLLALLSCPKSLERVRQDPTTIPVVVEETLRWETSVTMVNRQATEDVELGGTTIPAGSSVVCALGSANHDEARYQGADRWDMARAKQPHMAFGTGRHQCLGMHLARLELRVGLEQVLGRMVNLRLDPAEPGPAISGLAFRGPVSLPVTFDSVLAKA